MTLKYFDVKDVDHFYVCMGYNYKVDDSFICGGNLLYLISRRFVLLLGIKLIFGNFYDGFGFSLGVKSLIVVNSLSFQFINLPVSNTAYIRFISFRVSSRRH